MNPNHDPKTGRFTFGPGGLFKGGMMGGSRDRVSKRKTYEGPVVGQYSQGIDVSGEEYERWHPTAAQLRNVEKAFRSVGRNDIADMAKKQRRPKRVK